MIKKSVKDYHEINDVYKRAIRLRIKRDGEKREEMSVIGAKAHGAYYDHIWEIDPNSDLRKFLLQLGTMEMGPEFEFSYEELDSIADRLIAGEDVTLLTLRY